MRKNILLLFFGCIAFAMTAIAAPQLQQGSIVNAASFAVDGSPNAAIAQGSLFTVFGVDVGPTTAVNVDQFPLPTALGGVSVRVTVNGQNFDCPMIFVLNSQVSGILPSNVPPGTATLVLTYNGQASNAITFPVVPRMAGVFSRNSSGSGQSVIQNYISPSSQPDNALNQAAHAGQVAILWGTGLGASLNGDDRNLPAPGDLLPRDQVRVYVGGVQANVEYAGRSGCCAGVDQVNFVVPQNVEGCFVPVVVTLNGMPSNFTMMAIKNGGTSCDGAFGLDSNRLDQLISKVNLKTGAIGFTRTRMQVLGFNTSTEVGFGNFEELNSQGLLTGGSALGEGLFTSNSCSVTNYRTDFGNGNAGEQPDPMAPFLVRGLDAGVAISVAGPNGQKQLPKVTGETGQYFATLGDPLNPTASYLTPGVYTMSNGGGGADVGAFNFTKTIPTFIDWSNRDAISNIVRSQPLTVTWTAGQAQSGLVVISGISYSIPRKVSSSFFCYADPAAGTFTVPAYVLSAMVASDSSGNTLLQAGTLNVGGALSPGFFEAPGIDLGVFFVSAMDMKQVNYQ
ncbi:MAG: hypothetical protein IT169_03500 [Bryobacterales bacterium]|nr:hypothetical protein [Bryobacterales bacterium]